MNLTPLTNPQKRKLDNMNICIFGSGFVGSAVGMGFASLGHNVVFCDIDLHKIEGLVSQGYTATCDSKEAVSESDVIFICVPTPTIKRKISLSCVRAAAKEIGRQLRHKHDYVLVVVKSTVTPTTCEKMVIPTIERYSGKKAGADFGLCSNPEFLRQNKAFEDFMDPDRIVIGELDKRSGDLLESLYGSFSCPIVRTDIITSEMAKYANNAFYATKISFFNELHMICSGIGADSQQVRKIVQLDKFYATHPWEHGHCFGGACLPKDLDALIHFASSNGIKTALLKAVRAVNEEMASTEYVAKEDKSKPLQVVARSSQENKDISNSNSSEVEL